MQNPSGADPAAPRSFVGSARLVFGMTLASRVLGMVRDITAAAVFGASQVWDAFAIAFLVPNLFRRLFGEGALTSAFVPVFVDHLERQGRPAARRLLSALATWATLGLAALCAAGIAGALVVPRLTPDPQVARICGLLTILLPFMIPICLVAILSSALNSLGHFAMPALAPVALNLCMIGAMLWVGGSADRRITALAAAVVAAGLLEVLMLWVPLARRGMSPAPSAETGLPGLREIRGLFVPAVLGAGLLQINELVDQVIAELFVGEGGVSSLYYADRIAFLPLSLVAVALATAALPTLARAAARDDRAAFDEALSRGLRVALFLSVPAALGLLMLPDLIVRVLYQRNAFDASDAARTAAVLFWYSAGLVCYTVNQLLVRAFHARKDTARPFRLMAATVALNLVLNLLLVRTSLREAGLALSTAICGLVNTALLAASLRRRHGVRMMRSAAVTLGRTLLIAAVTAPVVWGLREAPIGPDPAKLALCIAAAVAVTFGLGAALCRAEVRDILGRS